MATRDEKGAMTASEIMLLAITVMVFLLLMAAWGVAPD